jgi:glucose uptake protein GlcU
VLKPSGTYVSMLIFMHLLAMAAVFLTDLPLWARSGLALLIFFGLFYHLYRQQWAGRAWRSFSLEQRHVLVNTLGGFTLKGELVRQTVITPICVVLCARFDVLPVCKVIFYDAMQADAFRELRVRLNYS